LSYILEMPKGGLDKFIQLNRKLEEKLEVTNYNDFSLEALKLSSKGGVGPEFLPVEAKRLFDSVKKFMEAAKKQGYNVRSFNNRINLFNL